MLDGLRHDVTKQLAHIRPMTEEEHAAMMQQLMEQQQAMMKAADEAQAGSASGPEPLIEGFDENDPSTWGDPGRNDPCPCGSGRKFKHCHGRVA